MKIFSIILICCLILSSCKPGHKANIMVKEKQVVFERGLVFRKLDVTLVNRSNQVKWFALLNLNDNKIQRNLEKVQVGELNIDDKELLGLSKKLGKSNEIIFIEMSGNFHLFGLNKNSKVSLKNFSMFSRRNMDKLIMVEVDNICSVDSKKLETYFDYSILNTGEIEYDFYYLTNYIRSLKKREKIDGSRIRAEHRKHIKEFKFPDSIGDRLLIESPKISEFNFSNTK